MKLAFFYFLNFFVLAVTAASVGKLNGVSGNVKTIDFDLNSDAFIVTQLDFAERLYKLDSQNQVIFSKDFASIIEIKFNSKNDAYIFEQTDEKTRNIWILSSNAIDISNQTVYTAFPESTGFFDLDDNLFLETHDGIGILRNGENVVNVIPRLKSYFLRSKDSYDVSANGNVYLGLNYGKLERNDSSVMLERAEIKQQEPNPYFLNVMAFRGIQSQRLLNDSLYVCQDIWINRYRNDDRALIYSRTSSPGEFCDFYVSNNRIFVKYLEKNTDSYDDKCFIKEFKADGTVVDTEISWMTPRNSCNYIYQTSDKYGTVFFGTSDYGSVISYIKVNDGTKKITFPNGLFIFGLATSDNGSLWILSQDLYLVPFGQTEAVKIKGLPYLSESWPFKAKPGSNDVFIGSHTGVYIGSI